MARGRLSLAAAALIVTLCLAACGSSSSKTTSSLNQTKVSAGAYVTALCQAVAPFEKDVAARSGALTTSTSTTASQGKSELVSYLGALSSDSDQAVDKLRGAGIPDVSGGAAYAKTILTTFTRLNTAMSRAKTLATKLSTSSQSDFQTGASNLATAVKESVSDLGKGLNTKSNKTLDQAAAKVSACHTL